MIQIKEKQDCCGCTACVNACPQKVIRMSPDSEGFLYPEINIESCIDCRLCERVCPMQNRIRQKEKTEGYIVRYKDEKIVEESTSGGAFTAFATFLLGKGYVVYGTGYDENMRVICKAAKRQEELEEMRGSKFVQSALGETFQTIREQLKNGEKILFTGTPCQIAGLISFLGRKPENLFCIDFVCRGVPSPGLWRNYIDVMEKKYGSKIIGARFKHKTYGYHATTMKVDFANGRTWYGSGRVDPMMRAFVNELASRPSCSDCAFKGVERLSDITMFDCYEFESITGKPDDDKGYTSLLVHTEKGGNLLKNLASELIVYEVSIDDLVAQNGIMVCNSAKPHRKREDFYRFAQRMPIYEAMQYISPITRKDYLIESLKGFLYKTHLIKAAKRLKHIKSIEISDKSNLRSQIK